MRIAQAVFGVFHHFALARELERRGCLEVVYSTWPWARLAREGLPRKRVRTFPWVHTPEILLDRRGLLPRWLDDDLGVLNALWFDEFTARKLPADVDVLIAISGAGLKTGRMLQARGGRFVCDRGSTHQRFQEQLISEEYRRWSVNLPVSDERDTLREEEIYEAADVITVPSSFALRSFVEMGVPAEKLHMIPYGAELSPAAEAVEAKPEEGLRVLFAGSVSLRKGIPYLLKAFARLNAPGKRLQLAGSVERCMKDVLPRLPLEDVELLGPLPRAALMERMRQSHVLVLPSVEDGFGLVMAEAMAQGCAVIASTNTGAEDLYRDGCEGFIVPVRDSRAIAERLQRLADDRGLLHQMRLAAFGRVQQIGGWSSYGDRWETLLRGLTGDPSPPPLFSTGSLESAG